MKYSNAIYKQGKMEQRNSGTITTKLLWKIWKLWKKAKMKNIIMFYYLYFYSLWPHSSWLLICVLDGLLETEFIFIIYFFSTIWNVAFSILLYCLVGWVWLALVQRLAITQLPCLVSYVLCELIMFVMCVCLAWTFMFLFFYIYSYRRGYSVCGCLSICLSALSIMLSVLFYPVLLLLLLLLVFHKMLYIILCCYHWLIIQRVRQK